MSIYTYRCSGGELDAPVDDPKILATSRLTVRVMLSRISPILTELETLCVLVNVDIEKKRKSDRIEQVLAHPSWSGPGFFDANVAKQFVT